MMIETRGFQTEAKQLLHLMIHSLYSNREIFLRELISNASDAIDKLRFESLSDDTLIADDPAFEIRIDFDADAKTLTVADNGIGMTREDVIDQLGTIAKSGTAEFFKRLTGNQRQDAQLIGQFGVGFYSAFMVADEVEVLTRRAGTSQGTLWKSRGEDEFTIEDAEAGRGTRVLLRLKSDAEEFAEAFRLKTIVRRYSDHIGVPVVMPADAAEAGDGDGEEAESAPADEVVNAATALWTRSRSEVTDDEYKEFYKHISHDFEDPLTWSHNRVEGRLEYTSLVFIPRRAPFDLWNRDSPRGLKLYVRRVFIMDDAEQFLPLYLRFVRGVVDSNDLPLNVSREILQDDPAVATIKNALAKRVLDALSRLEGDDYDAFWDEFGQVVKEGIAEDFANRDAIMKLLRFSSTAKDGDEQRTSLADYAGRMQEGQNKIYYLIADSPAAARQSPHLEVFSKRGIEVLLLTDRIDEWFMTFVNEFDGKSLQDITRGELDLDAGATNDAKNEAKDDAKEEDQLGDDGLAERIKRALEDRVESVRRSTRLTDSPACLVLGEHDMGAQMRRLMEATGQTLPDSKPHFEFNPDHPLVAKLDGEADEDRFADLVKVLFDQASLAEGQSLADPGDYVRRVNSLLLDLLA